MSNEFDISFIVPVYNTSVKIFQRCIDSISLIRVLKYEIITIDDGSSSEYARHYDYIVQTKENCRCIHQKHQGVSRARNIGIAAAKGKYIYFVDSDDTVLPEAFQNIMDYEQQLVFTNIVVTMEGHLEEWDAFSGESRKILPRDVLRKMTQSGKLNGPCAKLINTCFIKENNIRFKEDMITGEDAVFLMNMIACGPSMYYKKKNSYCYHKTISTDVSRLKTKTSAYIGNNVKLYKYLLNSIKKNYADGSQEHRVLCIAASENFIKQIFNIAAELSELHALTENNKKLIEEAISQADSNFKNKYRFLIKIRSSVISNRKWNIIKVFAGIRKVYLKLKFR